MVSRFESKKRKILEQLNTAASDYHDLSPKGSVDELIMPLIDAINRTDGLVTTSSCSGRMSVFLEGKKRGTGNHEQLYGSEDARAGPGGKGGGSWLYISHDPYKAALECSPDSQYMPMFGLQSRSSTLPKPPDPNTRYIHLKFEPMILHVLTASTDLSQRVLTAALSSGFRESGAVGLAPFKSGEVNPLVAIRSTGYSFDAIIGRQDQNGTNIALVDESYLGILIGIANDRFTVNAERIERLRLAFLQQFAMEQGIPVASSTDTNSNRRKPAWEDSETRKGRLKEEGLARQHALQVIAATTSSEDVSSTPERPTSLGDLFN
ncbi:methyltransferase TYW3-domain-containing protein [Lophiotrema nucula]|uniref:tRNA(Phe) 7-[(3-amino-3-carboxypropyl)-4-demethylwyosine(37)-N(4)]-methyltransferase n=1 Tax=Lophiotrema nucula TaxID=690887 RepID=A0A6A5ZAP2_9PLEO|nr:methyltransferase TYW3-domain-containing protein [Lophiotrema nucula]